MPLLVICLRNAQFVARDEGREFVDPHAAMAAGLSSAATVAANEIIAGRSSTAIVVTIEQEDGTPLLDSVLALSVSSLLTPAMDDH